MLALTPPFQGDSEYLLFQNILSGTFTFPPDFDPTARDFVAKLLLRDPTQRMDPTQMKAHPFLASIDFATLRSQTPPIRPPSSDPPPQRSQHLLTSSPLVVPAILPATARAPTPTGSACTNTTPPASPARGSGRGDEAEGAEMMMGAGGGQTVLFPATSPVLSLNHRQLVLTNFPRLIYIDPSRMVQKGTVPWSARLYPEARDAYNFIIHTPNRRYYLEDPSGNAHRWVEAIMQQHALQQETPAASALGILDPSAPRPDRAVVVTVAALPPLADPVSAPPGHSPEP
ncbi:putative 3-phosphoinositide-dependent protein kinase 1 [Paratrimastix pyriformis]|uniref:3-phosphoinositide-dependent protein kinase 1 n=1 Tax=Paratrimastix pyriformis TaxID=342808 RepID=A0ABQ8UKD9_9EUKA|nr:putative 3-phosphoinositide-dependent protein kinase 1 [Paratrimastix pyriformis]